MEGERGGDEKSRRREREQQAAEAELIEVLGKAGLGPEAASQALEHLRAAAEPRSGDPPTAPADDAQAWEEADRARREFAWFGEQAAPDDADEAGWPLRDPGDRPLSPWSLERDVLDTAAIAALVATGLTRHEAAEQIETTTDRERYERARAAGVNAEDALSAVEGARLLQRLQADRRLREDQQRQMGAFITGSLAHWLGPSPAKRPASVASPATSPRTPGASSCPTSTMSTGGSTGSPSGTWCASRVWARSA